MNQYQKEQVLALRTSGETCAHIADNLGLSVNTVKSFCRRNNIQGKSETKNSIAASTDKVDACPQCGNKIIPVSGRKPKKFCSDECRVLWWNSHSGEVKRKALYMFKCASCGKDFTAYGNAKRRYCSHSCYCTDRFGRKERQYEQG
jgi:endogenous inhibitor of DNA gyrase (YacG/DUF329 family)